MRWPGIEPGSTAWKAAMLATIPPTLVVNAGLQELVYNSKSSVKVRSVRNFN